MDSYDKRIFEGLTSEDQAFLKNLEDDRGLFTQMFATFDGPLKYWTIYVFVMTFAFFGLGVYAGFQLVAPESVQMIAVWTLVIWFCLFAVGMLKIWLFMRMNHLATRRELKKIEFLVLKGQGV